MVRNSLQSKLLEKVEPALEENLISTNITKHEILIIYISIKVTLTILMNRKYKNCF